MKKKFWDQKQFFGPKIFFSLFFYFLGHKVAHQKTEPQNVSLLGKLSSQGHKVAYQKTEAQNVSLVCNFYRILTFFQMTK